MSYLIFYSSVDQRTLKRTKYGANHCKYIYPLLLPRMDSNFVCFVRLRNFICSYRPRIDFDFVSTVRSRDFPPSKLASTASSINPQFLVSTLAYLVHSQLRRSPIGGSLVLPNGIERKIYKFSSNWTRLPAEFKHISRRRKRN